jgi:GST-like protein
MIQLYYWPTPNGHKITMYLEEAGLDYTIHPVDISAGEQFKPEYLRLSPNNRMPSIIDPEPSGGGEPVSVFESGAILVYLAEKTGKLIPHDLRGRKTVLEWLFWQGGRPRAHGRAEPPLRSVRAREDPVRNRALRRRDEPALWRFGPLAGRP